MVDRAHCQPPSLKAAAPRDCSQVGAAQMAGALAACAAPRLEGAALGRLVACLQQLEVLQALQPVRHRGTHQPWER